MPLRFGIYARGNTTPVLDLKATNISYGAVPASIFAISPPSGAKVVKISPQSTAGKPAQGGEGRAAQLPEVTGLAAVAAHVPFTLTAPGSLVGLPRHE